MSEARWAWSSQYNDDGEETRARGYGWRYQAIFDTDTVVVGSGVFEIALGTALTFMPGQKRLLGGIAGTLFTCTFLGNIAQYEHRRNAFGLDTDQKRFVRLFFQPVLVAWALWSTGSIRSVHNTQRDQIKEPPRDDPDKDDPPTDEPGKNGIHQTTSRP